MAITTNNSISVKPRQRFQRSLGISASKKDKAKKFAYRHKVYVGAVGPACQEEKHEKFLTL
jgi:hypothetical protein